MTARCACLTTLSRYSCPEEEGPVRHLDTDNTPGNASSTYLSKEEGYWTGYTVCGQSFL